MLVCPCNKLFNLQFNTVNKKKGSLEKKIILEWQVFIFWSFGFSNIGFIQILAFQRQILAFESKILKNCNGCMSVPLEQPLLSQNYSLKRFHLLLAYSRAS